MSNLNLFAPLIRSHPELSGEIVLDARTYRWQLHLARIPKDWVEEFDAPRGQWSTPGWAFGLLHRSARGDWLPVKDAARTQLAWQSVRERPEVRAELRARSAVGGQA